MAAQTQMVDWRERQNMVVIVVWYGHVLSSVCLRHRGLKSHRQEEEHGRNSDAELCVRYWRGAFRLLLKGSVGLLVPWLLSDEVELSGFRFSICVEAISTDIRWLLTSAAHCECLLQ